MQIPFIAIALSGTTKAGFNHLTHPVFVVVEGETKHSFYGRAIFRCHSSYGFRFKKSNVIALTVEDESNLQLQLKTGFDNYRHNDFLMEYVKIWKEGNKL